MGARDDRLGKKPVNHQAGSLQERDRESFDRNDRITTNQNLGHAWAKSWLGGELEVGSNSTG